METMIPRVSICGLWLRGDKAWKAVGTKRLREIGEGKADGNGGSDGETLPRVACGEHGGETERGGQWEIKVRIRERAVKVLMERGEGGG